METKTIIAVIAAIIGTIGMFPYLNDIRKKTINPSVLSWIGWTFITALSGFAMLDSGSKWILINIFSSSLICLFVAIYSVIQKVGVWATTKLDYLFFGLGVLGLTLWQTFDMPILAIVCAILADFSFGLPTLIKTYKGPKTESYFMWLMCSVAYFISFFAAKNFTFSELAFSLYLFIFEFTMFLIIVKDIRKNKKTFKLI